MDFLPSLPTLLAFAAATLLLAATPGPDMTLSISRALAQGKKAALFVVVGTSPASSSTPCWSLSAFRR